MGVAHLDIGHLCADVGAAADEDVGDDFFPGFEGTAQLGGTQDVGAVDFAVDFKLGLDFFHAGGVLFLGVGVPGGVEAVAVVAEVSGDGGGVDEFLLTGDVVFGEGFVGFFCLEGFCGAVLSVTEEDELDAVEAQEFLAQFGSGIGNAVFAFEHGYLVGVTEGRCKGFGVQRPGVDVRVDAEGSGGTVEEGFGLFPVFAGFEEGLADGVDVGLGEVFPGRCFRERRVEVLGFVGEDLVCAVDDLGNIGVDGLSHFGLVFCCGVRAAVFVAAGEDQCHEGKES